MENLDDFNNKREFAIIYRIHHVFHDSYITNVNYNIELSQIEIIINVCWVGESKLKEDGTYETNNIKMKMVFNDVEQYTNKEIFSWIT